MNPFKNGMIEAVYIIHARRFTDRAAHVTAQLKRFEIPFEFIEPFDADTLDSEIRHRFMDPGYKLPLAKFSCTLKHFEAQRRIALKGHRLALVLEDDVILNERFNDELAKIVEESKSFDHPYTIQIGCANHMYVPKRLLRPGKRVYEAKEVRAADSYLIGAKAAALRRDWLEHNKISLATTHSFNLIDREKNIRVYWSEPTLVEQGSMNGLFPTSMDAKRKNRSSSELKIRFWWRRIWTKYLTRPFK